MMNSKLSFCKCTDVGLLLMRLALAVVFLSHGIQKLGHIDGTIAFFGPPSGLRERHGGATLEQAFLNCIETGAGHA